MINFYEKSLYFSTEGSPLFEIIVVSENCFENWADQIIYTNIQTYVILVKMLILFSPFLFILVQTIILN